MADELTKPLGLPETGRRRRPPLVALLAPPVAIALAVAAFFVFRLAGADPAVVATIAGTDPSATGSVPKARPLAPGEPGLVELSPVGDLKEVTRGNVTIRDPSAPAPIQLAAAPREDLVEKSAYGLLPRVAGNGLRPIDAYRRPPSDTKGLRQVAIVIGGFGLADSDEASKLQALPGVVTIGVAPYGKDLPGLVSAARADGHELLLQVPLEPYGYPEIDPGPKTLTTDASPAENLDRLRWLMSRLTTYVGVVNYMGARFTSEPGKMQPVMDEVDRRGLLYLDDGSSARSAGDTADEAFLRADIVLDADTDPAAIDKRLDELAAIAKTKGTAIATGSAFATTIDRVAAFIRAAADRGIAVVPITALLPART